MTRNEAVEFLKKGEAGLRNLKKAELIELCSAVGTTPQKKRLTRVELIKWIQDVTIPHVLASAAISDSKKLKPKFESVEQLCKRLGIPFKDTTAEHAGKTTIILVPQRPKDQVERAEEALTEFQDPDVEFIAVPDQGRVVLQIGLDFYSQFEEMGAEEIRQAAEKHGYLECAENGYIDEHGVVVIERCREALIEDEDSANIVRATHTYPCGRAFDYFEGSDVKFPDEIGLSLVEWGHMSPLYLAVVPDPHSVVELQRFLSANGVKANFTFASSWEVWGI